jgi:NADH-quinone oxidoreductase subunit J
MLQLLAVIVFGLMAIWFGLRVFMTSSMVRSAFSLLGSMAALGMLFLTLETEFLGVLQLMMMGSEMSIMALFMMMFMMDPGGMGKMDMSHQKKLAKTAAVVGIVLSLVGLVALYGTFGRHPVAPSGSEQLRGVGLDIMAGSLLVFESAGVSILTAMVAATMLATTRDRRKL